MKLHDGSEKLLSDVRYIPDLRRNLISLGVLDTDGMWFKYDNGMLKVFDKSMLVKKRY